jgi:hypothetical protein
MELGGARAAVMDQHPKVTLGWALHGLERALQNLGDGWAERRVRRQFHQLLLAVERDATHPHDGASGAGNVPGQSLVDDGQIEEATRVLVV